ncbi:hypothetical protein Tco_0923049 [Tanacetum coccineum]|uniref:Retrovirus-related Pol polyprotein from transposon TNT 1-94-like beta-barrel domain-containing protein n=1 Tax=Tanacetum coccineum TaxID=301880 RepID=A0ABQ5CZV3_9ASTR
MMDVVNQMRLHGEVVKDQKVVEKMMISVPPKFEAKISAIEESCILEHAYGFSPPPELTSKLQAQEQRVSIRSEEKVEVDAQSYDSGKKNIDSYISLDTKDNPRVKLGDGRYTRAKGRGTIAINTKKGTKYISRVLYVPELDRSMLSVPQMIKNGYGVNFKNDTRCVITDFHDVKIATLDMENDSYYLKLDVADASAF